MVLHFGQVQREVQHCLAAAALKAQIAAGKGREARGASEAPEAVGLLRVKPLHVQGEEKPARAAGSGNLLHREAQGSAL